MFLCTDCLARNLDSQAVFQALYAKVREILEHRRNLVVRPPPDLAAVRFDESGVLGSFDGRVVEVEQDQQLLFLMGVIAHEYAHGWHRRENPNFERLAEGFATWVQCDFLELIGQPGLARRVLNIVPESYSEGYRTFKQMELERGYQGVLKAVRAR